MAAKRIQFVAVDFVRIYCPLTGTLVISTDDIPTEERLLSRSPYFRFFMYYDRQSYPAFWATDPCCLSKEQSVYQDLVISTWANAADVGRHAVGMDGDWYTKFLDKAADFLPSSAVILESSDNISPPAEDAGEDMEDPKQADVSLLASMLKQGINIDWDHCSGFVTAVAFDFQSQNKPVTLKKIKTIWDDWQ